MKNVVISDFIALPTREIRSQWVLEQIYQKLSPTHCFIGKFVDDNTVKSSLHLKNGQVVNNISYPLEGTPCAEAKKISGVCCYPIDVQRCFPEDIDLNKLAIQGYMGIAIRSFNNEVVGLLVCLFDRELDESQLDKQWFTDVSYLLGVEISYELTSKHQSALISKLELGEELAKTCIIEWNTVTDDIIHSEQIYSVLGLTPHTLVTRKKLMSITPQRDHAYIENEINQVLVDGLSHFKFNIKVINGENGFKYVAILGRLGIDKITEAPILQMVLQDISEIYHINQALYLSNMMFEHTIEPVMITDKDNRIIQVNNAFVSCSGYSIDEVIGQYPSMLNSGEHGAEFFQDMWQVLHQEGCWHGEVYNKRKSGEIVPVAVSINEVKNESQEITNYIAVFKDISVWKETEKKLSFYANNEPITGLYNRRAFLQRLEQDSRERSLQPFTIAYIDIVRFKDLNDIYGQDICDQLLEFVGQSIKSIIEGSDLACRYGGDEFVVKLTNLNINQSEKIVRKLLDICDKPITINHLLIDIHICVGLAHYPESAKKIPDLMRAAHHAMHSVKYEELSSIGVYDAQLHQDLLRDLALREKLKLAIKQQELTVYYQPIINVRENKIEKFEALVRWQDEDYGFISPDEFIAIAEKSNLIIPLGQFVLEQSCESLAKIHSLGYGDISIAINRSINEFRYDNNQVEAISTAAAKHGLSHQHIIIEVTESVAMSSNLHAKNVLNELRAHHFKVSLDDFCTGYSSLSNLMDYSADILKIDRTFIRKLLTEDKNQILTNTLIELAHKLGMSVVAEGVEEQEQLDLLRKLNCDYIQGYFYSPAIPIEQCLDLLSYFDKNTRQQLTV
ncbi:putative bifunctional diguanylate cyclase/phosphodiesterase [Thalassotalea atypica]|uniref:putative bifunctional diguanylate cyclase/phosphodiesterase n=1 Tax=Thalassotalea atypica TaxID=2054316 RepID=UPI0025748427|nr:GGDEF domain-containing phosphodiesterase [Thalassotalea atypica]